MHIAQALIFPSGFFLHRHARLFSNHMSCADMQSRDTHAMQACLVINIVSSPTLEASAHSCGSECLPVQASLLHRAFLSGSHTACVLKLKDQLPHLPPERTRGWAGCEG